MSEFVIREIQAGDNAGLAHIVRSVLAEFGANKPGTVYFDPTTDRLSEVFAKEGSIYFVAEDADGKMLGGGGVYPTEGLPASCCELVKLYLLPEARGKGLGKLLILKCLEAAQLLGFTEVYLETMPELKMAMGLYESCGFEYLPGPMGNSGHFGCDLWMLKEI